MVYVHPQAKEQCLKFIDGKAIKFVNSNPEAIDMAIKHKCIGIGPSEYLKKKVEAGREGGIQEGVQDNGFNTTKFLFFGDESEFNDAELRKLRSEEDHFYYYVFLKNERGALLELLLNFSDKNLNYESVSIDSTNHLPTDTNLKLYPATFSLEAKLDEEEINKLREENGLEISYLGQINNSFPQQFQKNYLNQN